MKKIEYFLTSALFFAVATGDFGAAFGQGFGGYVAPPASSSFYSAPQNGAPSANSPSPQTPSPQFVAQNPTAPAVAPNPQAPIAAPRQPLAPSSAAPRTAPAPTNIPPANAPTGSPQQPIAPGAVTPQRAATAPQGGYLPEEPIPNAIVPPPSTFQTTENDQLKLDEFLAHWENFGKGIKRISCKVHTMEFDGGLLQQDAKKPLAHTWGEFRFIAPNKLYYHVLGEFSYEGAESVADAVWKESQNEMKIVLDGKSMTIYDFKNKNAVVYPIAEEEQNVDLTMDNGQFPLFFIAKAELLKNRFYMRLITPQTKQQSEVWIEAFPKFARDAQQFQSIVVILSLKDMQPTYMRKIGVNGKSKTDLKFEEVTINKGRWTIEGTVDAGWTKEVREESFSLLQQAPIESSFVRQNANPNDVETSVPIVSAETAARQGAARVATANPTAATANSATRPDSTAPPTQQSAAAPTNSRRY